MNVFQANKTFRDYVLLFFLTLVVYWPLSLNLLSLKNDALVLFSFRYHISEALRHGYLPFWTPYLYTGLPMHADMQGSVWNPFVIVLSLLGRYDITILQWEVLFYLFLAAVGMYRLVRFLHPSRPTAVVCAFAFMSCGFMTDSISIIPWISSAAFIPFVLLYFLRLLASPQFAGAIKLSLALSLMFLCGYPSFFIYLNYILGIGFLVSVVDQFRKDDKNTAGKTSLYLGFAYLLFLFICSPAIMSYYDFLPYYSRGAGISWDQAAENPLLPFSLTSYLLANVPSKAGFLHTDLSMRSTYFGLFLFLFFLVSLKNLDRFKVLVLVFTIFSVLFSLGDATPIHQLSYHLPLMNTFRHPGTIRVFTSIGMILLAAYSLRAFLENKKDRGLRWLSIAVWILVVAAAVYFTVVAASQQLPPHPGVDPASLKVFLYALSFEQFSWFICLLQIGFLSVFVLLLRKDFQRRGTIALLIANSLVFAWIGLPFTVVSQYRTSVVDHYIHSFPAGYPSPDVHLPVGSDVYSDSAGVSPYGYSNFYNKRITIQDHVVTPTLNTDYHQFLSDRGLRLRLKDHPFVFVSPDSVPIQAAAIRILKFTPNSFSFQVNSPLPGNLQLFQQYNSCWQVSVDHHPVRVRQSNIAFMSVPIPGGSSVVEWKYNPRKVYAAMIMSALSLCSILLYFVIKRNGGRIYE